MAQKFTPTGDGVEVVYTVGSNSYFPAPVESVV